METIRSDGLMCTNQCHYLGPPGGSRCGGGFSCKLIEQVFGFYTYHFHGPGYRCPFAVLREVLVPQPVPADLPPKPIRWAPTTQEFQDAIARLDRRSQCKGCRWSPIRKCAPPLNGGPCHDREEEKPPRPLRTDLTPTEWCKEAIRFEDILRSTSVTVSKILDTPAVEARTCSGDWDNCGCMRCQLLRLRDWILRRAATP